MGRRLVDASDSGSAVWLRRTGEIRQGHLHLWRSTGCGGSIFARALSPGQLFGGGPDFRCLASPPNGRTGPMSWASSATARRSNPSRHHSRGREEPRSAQVGWNILALFPLKLVAIDFSVSTKPAKCLREKETPKDHDQAYNDDEPRLHWGLLAVTSCGELGNIQLRSFTPPIPDPGPARGIQRNSKVFCAFGKAGFRRLRMREGAGNVCESRTGPRPSGARRPRRCLDPGQE